MITCEQIRAAMAGLGWNKTDLACNTGLPTRTVSRICGESGVPNTNARNLAAIQRALEAAEVTFTATGVELPLASSL